MPTDQNIILIIIDALRPDHLGYCGYDKPTSPCLDGIAQNSIKYTQAFSTSNCTMPSIVSINTGLHPLQHGVRHVGLPYQNPEFNNLATMGIKTLPRILKDNGYETGAVDWLGGFLMDGYTYYSSVIRDTDVYDNASNVTKVALGFIKKKQKKPFFLFIHYWDTHDPYHIGKVKLEPFQTAPTGRMVSEVRPHLVQLKDADISTVNARYDAAIRNVDNQISKLYDYLESIDLMKKTVIIITADHGESLGEHDVWFTHFGLYDVTLHIPLLIHLPSKQHYFDTTLTLHQDLFPTILKCANIKTEPYYYFGRNLLCTPTPHNKPQRDFLIALEATGYDYETLRYPKWKLIDEPRERDSEFWYKDNRGLGEPQLYNLKDDPNETNNQATQYANVTKELQKILQHEIHAIKKEFTDARNPG